MRPNFSEFSYGYSITEALVSGRQHLVRPVFPTLRDEWEVGYDVLLNFPGSLLMLQFKLCHGMMNKGAKEIKKFQLALPVPFLRLPLMPAHLSPQHAVLLEQESLGHLVFYAAPRFFRDSKFATHYSNRAVLSHSAFIRPSTIGHLPDKLDHHVAFDPNANQGWLLSEPVRIRPILDGRGFEDALAGLIDSEVPLSDQVRYAIVDMTDTVIKVTREFRDPFAYRLTLRQLCQDVRRVYPNFPATDEILGMSDEIEEGNPAHRRFQHELRRVLEISEFPILSLILLKTLALVHCDAELLLFAGPRKHERG